MSTSFFNQASQLAIDRSNITSIAGNQYNYNLLDPSSLNVRENSILSQYQSIRTGDLRIRQILLTEYIDDKERLIKYQIIPRGRCLQYTRTVKQATIIAIGKEVDGTFLEVEYGGKNAKEAWKRDLEQYHEYHHPNVVHLFAINHIKPALIFCDNLIPIMKIWNDASPVLQLYLEWRVKNDMTNIFWTYGPKFHSESLDIGGFFLDPSTGMICAATHTSYSQKLPLGFGSTYAFPWQTLTLLPDILQTPHNFNIFQYFDSNWIDFHSAIASIPTFQYLQATTALPITLGSVMYLESNTDQWNDETLSRPLKSIGQFPNAEYDPAQSWVHFKPGTLMDNVWTRCTLDQLFESNVIPLYNWPRAVIHCGENLHPAWLSQAHCYVDRNKKQNYVIADDLFFHLVPESSLLPQVVPTNLYLFIAPIQILPSPENGTLVHWGENGKTYYWSLDPDGKQRLSDKVSDFLGLPRFQPRIYLPSWTNEQYEAIFQYQVYKGYDPYSDDYACEHGWPLVDLIHTPEPEVDDFDTCDVNEDSSDEWEDLAEAESGSTNSGTDSEAEESLQSEHSDGNASVEVVNIPYPYLFSVPMHFQQHIFQRGYDDLYMPTVQLLKHGCGASPWLYGLLEAHKSYSARGYFYGSAGNLLFSWRWIPVAQNNTTCTRGIRKRANSLPRSFKSQKPEFVV